MTDFTTAFVTPLPRPEFGRTLRKELYGKMTDILERSEGIADSGTRLSIQACCLDVISSLEDMIADLGLDSCLS
ncbi:MAG: hypothetical protein K1X79_11820 [Oligoflexia bacterium]|nr:hypothetical protein [Oligoflexia bacterium]